MSISRHAEGANAAEWLAEWLAVEWLAVAWNVASESRARRHAASSSRFSAAARCASRERYTTSAGIAFCCVCGRAFAFGERDGAFCDR